MATVSLLDDDALAPRARAVFEDIRATRDTDFINNFWRALAHDPETLEAVWSRLKTVMSPGALDPLTKELIYVAVSTANGCDYCIHSHTAAAKSRGMTPDMQAELVAVIGMAMQTNGLVRALGVETDDAFLA
ncbi:MAG: carboxymuconolactone decarboxylase family protein [Pseudomonadota bacterium]